MKKLENKLKGTGNAEITTNCQKINEIGDYPYSSTLYYNRNAKKYLVIKDVELKNNGKPAKFKNYEKAYDYAYSIADFKND
jgi:hypothetical protein